MRRKMIPLYEAAKLYGKDNVEFKRPRYVPEGACEWCGKLLPKRQTSCCCQNCTRAFNKATNGAWGNSIGGYRNHIMRRDNYTCQICGEFHALINVYGITVPTTDGMLDVHHIIPVNEGGDDSPKNLIEIIADKTHCFSYGDTAAIQIFDNEDSITLDKQLLRINSRWSAALRHQAIHRKSENISKGVML